MKKSIVGLGLLALVGCADGMHGAHDLVPVNRAANNGQTTPPSADSTLQADDVPELGPNKELPDVTPDDPRLQSRDVGRYTVPPTEGLVGQIKSVQLADEGSKRILALDIEDSSGHKRTVHFDLPAIQPGQPKVDLKTITSVDNPELQLRGDFEAAANGVINGDLTVQQLSAPQPATPPPASSTTGNAQPPAPAPTVVASAEILTRTEDGTATFSPKVDPTAPADQQLKNQVADLQQLTDATIDTFTVIAPEDSATPPNTTGSPKSHPSPGQKRRRPAKSFVQARLKKPKSSKPAGHPTVDLPELTISAETQQGALNEAYVPAAAQGSAAPKNSYYMGSPDQAPTFYTTLDAGSHTTTGILTVVPRTVSATSSDSEMKEDAVKFPPFSEDGAYLRMDLNDPEIARTVHDLNQNIVIPGVQDYIYKLQNDDRFAERFSKFLETANPARTYFETIFSAYHVPPALAYLTVIESGFFFYSTGPRHVRRPYVPDVNPSSSSAGPFMMNYGTASGIGDMKVIDNSGGGQSYLALRDASDERNYLIPSTCGAAKLLSYLTNLYEKGDHTLIILGFSKGEMGAIRPILRDQNLGGQTAFYDFLDSMDQYPGTTYRSLVGRRRHGSSVLPPPFIDYANRFLAYYFVGGNLKGYNFPTPQYRTEAIPLRRLVPGSPMRNSTCNQLWQTLQH
jgi:hypothetical protein